MLGDRPLLVGLTGYAGLEERSKVEGFDHHFLKPAPYRYGLDTVEPGVPGTYLDVQRGKDELAIRVQPRAMPGGVATRYVADESKLKEFFAFRLAKP